MPLYQYRCTTHGTFELLHEVPRRRGPRRCPRCGTHGEPLISPGIRGGGFRPYREWNLDPDKPVDITSASQLDRECAARGLQVKGGGGLSRIEQRRIEEQHESVHRRLERKKHA